MRRNLRYAIRQLPLSPGFALVAVLTLALGVGANTAVFSVVNEVLIRPLPFDEPEELVTIYLESDGGRRQGPTDGSLVDIGRDTDLFEHIGRYQGPLGRHLVSGGAASRVQMLFTNGALFRALGVSPVIGRWFGPDDGLEAAILSQGLWEQAFGADPDILGETVQIHGEDFIVVGIAPPDFQVPTVAVPISAYRNLPDREEPDRVWFRNESIARLKPGISIEQAQASLDVFTEAQRERFDKWSGRDISTQVRGIHEFTVADIRPTLLMLLGTSLFVLLIACVNVANLLLIRADARSRETAIRLAIGSDTRRLARQHMIEAGLLGVLGGGGGLILAVVMLPALYRSRKSFPAEVLRFGLIRSRLIPSSPSAKSTASRTLRICTSWTVLNARRT